VCEYNEKGMANYSTNSNMLGQRKWSIYLSIILATVIMGLGSRHFAMYLPRWVNLYLGDFLWAFMMFFIFAILLRGKSTLQIIAISLAYCYLIEISQIYHSPWIDYIRQSTVGHLILGRGFLWSDLISYTIGILAASVIDRYFQ
jgi:hypothetical protein